MSLTAKSADEAQVKAPTNGLNLSSQSHEGANMEEKAAQLRQVLEETISAKSTAYEAIRQFTTRNKINRMTIDCLGSLTENYHKLEAFDSQLACDYSKFCGLVDEQALEKSDDPFAYSKIEALFEEYGSVKDKALELFGQMKSSFPTNPKVIEHLKFLTSAEVVPTQPENLPSLPKSSSGGSERGEEYVRTKIPKIQKTVGESFATLETLYNESPRTVSLDDIEKSLVSIENKICDGSAYEKLLREIFEFENAQEIFEEAEKWKDDTLLKIQTLKTKLQAERKKTEVVVPVVSKSSAQTFLKKRDPPEFGGDCLEYMDFKRKWNNLVHSNNPPEDFEMDLLKSNITEQGRKKLFGVESLNTAWRLLDKLYGDKKLICQKLKNKLKNLKPKSVEEHEIIIELSDEVDYLVKRLTELDAISLLKIDNDYLNAVYVHLPKYNQTAWDMFEVDDYDDEWQAFMVFMNEISIAALKKRTRVESLKEMGKMPDKNSSSGKRTVTALSSNVSDSDNSKSNALSDAKYKAKFDEIKSKIGKCKCCNGDHSYKNRWNRTWPSDRLFGCKKFNDMTPTKRAELLQKISGCARCTSWLHQKKDCPNKVIECKEKINSVQCKGDHSKLVCNSGVAYINTLLLQSNQSSMVNADFPALSYLLDVKLANGNTCRVLFDNGSNRILFHSEFAEENKLYKRDASICLNVAGGGHEYIDTQLYEVDLVDRMGNRHAIWGYGLENIIEPEEPVDLSPVRDLFPHLPDCVFQTLPKRRVDILIGLNFNRLHPVGGEGLNSVGDLKVLSTIFGPTGFIVGGTHPLLKVGPRKFSPTVAKLRVAKVSVSPVVDCLPEFLPVSVVEEGCCLPVDIGQNPVSSKLNLQLEGVQTAKIAINPELLPDYWTLDQLGVMPPRRCSKCRQCAERGQCSEQHLLRSLKDETELRMIEDNVTIEDGVIRVKYPFIKDPSILPPNREVVVRVAEKLWRSLVKEGHLDQYHAEMLKYMERGTFVQLSDEEMNSYEGPFQWITHHGVFKGSVSTPLRVVTNSSFNNHGNSLNSCLPRGPNSLNDLFAITVRFRCYKKVFAYDLSKAYNTMKTGAAEKHLRRFVWRWDVTQPWQDYAINAVHFGDAPAACLLEVSKRKLASLGHNIDEEAATKLVRDSYVDDNFSGGDAYAVQRMVGERLPNGDYSGTISRILALGGFKVKEFVIEGDENQPDENLLGNSVFGYGWNAKTGLMSLDFKLNMSKKKSGVRSGPDLSVESLSSLRSFKFTKRTLLGLTNSFGDFLGMAEPYTLKFKLRMKDIFYLDEPLGWDEEINEEMKIGWINLISETVRAGGINFARSTRPGNSIGGPVIAGFGDGGKPSYGAAVYLVWEYSCFDVNCAVSSCLGPGHGGHFSSSLACGKARVTPLQGYTVPRSELSGATLLSRLVLKVARSIQFLDVMPANCVLMLDSKCTLSLLEANAKLLKPFFQNRRAEILENLEYVSKICPVEQPHYIESSLNVADLCTRGHATLDDVALGGLWQTGPTFLVQGRDSWPISRDFSRTDLPSEEIKSKDKLITLSLRSKQLSNSMEFSKVHSCIENFEAILKYSNDLESRKRVVARILRGWKVGMVKDGDWSLEQRNFIGKEPTRQELLSAERLILKHGMIETASAFESGQLQSLLPFHRDGIIYTRGRLGQKSMEEILGVPELPVLLPQSRVAELFMWRAHCGCSGLFHRSSSETLAKSRASVWIVKGKQLAKRICSQCMICSREKKKSRLEIQQMAELKEESSSICPPWTYVCLDYAGPVYIKGEVNSRSRGKAWILVYTCRSTKAVCLLPTAGYSTSHFLARHAEFVARKGKPRSIVTDRGTNLVKGAITLAEKEKPGSWDWAEVVRANSVSEWEFVPIGSQHRNGLAESTVKVLKKSLGLALAPGVVLSFSELVTLLAQITHSINCRPLGLDRTSGDSQQEDEFLPITPNHLLLGRSGEDAPPIEFEETGSLTRRMAYVSQVHEAWWRLWIKQVLPTLIPIRRWKKKSRNVAVGDVCFLHYSGNLKDDYRLVRIVKTHPDKNGLVRTVTVSYRRRDRREKPADYKKKPLVEENVAVQRLSVLLSAKDQLNV